MHASEKILQKYVLWPPLSCTEQSLFELTLCHFQLLRFPRPQPHLTHALILKRREREREGEVFEGGTGEIGGAEPEEG